jgi:hypothetical protein
LCITTIAPRGNYENNLNQRKHFIGIEDAVGVELAFNVAHQFQRVGIQFPINKVSFLPSCGVRIAYLIGYWLMPRMWIFVAMLCPLAHKRLAHYPHGLLVRNAHPA